MQLWPGPGAAPTIEHMFDRGTRNRWLPSISFMIIDTEEDEAEAEDPELDAMWESFFPAAQRNSS